MMEKVKKLTETALLIALTIIIPMYLPKIPIGPAFTMTPASHVPMFLSMFLGPTAAAMVGIGSTIGFQMAGTPSPVVARASMHIIVGVFGAYLLKKNVSYIKVALITAPLHGLAEALVIIPLVGFNANSYIVAVGTMIHHCVDVIITYPVIKALEKAGRKEFALSK
ncbi:MAG: ECF transporter S component [Clostridiales bacterium]|nr:ECF transporter S component [Clostridiales bacterium]